MRDFLARTLIAAIALMLALPVPLATATPPARGAGSEAAINPDLEPEGFEHRGRVIPTTKDRSEHPGRSLGQGKQALKGWPIDHGGKPIAESDVAEINPATSGPPADVGPESSPPAATTPTDGLVGPSLATEALDTPINRIIRGDRATGLPSFQAKETLGTWSGTWTPGTPSTRSGVVIQDVGFTDGRVELWSAVGQTLSVGSYDPATHFSSGSVPAFSVSTAGASLCHPGTGDFEVLELSVDGGGTLLAFAAELRMQCGTNAPEFVEIRFQSTIGYSIATQGSVAEFPLTPIGTTSSPDSATISNQFGVSNLDFGTGVLGGDTHFAIESDTCSNASIAPGGQCVVSFSFSPDGPMAPSAALTFSTNSTAEQVSASASGSTPVALTISNVGSGTGQVNSCSSSCAYEVAFGLDLHLIATPNPGSLFVSWSGGTCSGTEPTCWATMTGTSISIVANWADGNTVYIPYQYFDGSVTSSPQGIDCPGTCGAQFAAGTTVTLTYHGLIGYELLRWEGPCSGSGACTFTLSGDVTVAVVTGLKEAHLAGIAGTTPNLRSTGGFPGTRDDAFRCHDRPCLEPPDSWVAAGPSHIVEATNDGVRITDRSGTILADYFLWDFFLEDDDEVVSADPRVIYDAAAGRWVATAISADCFAGTIYLAISTGANPTGAWDVFALRFEGLLPDYPGLGKSGDKFALGYDLFQLSGCSVGFQTGSRLTIVDRSELLAAPASLDAAGLSFDSTYTVWRPAVAATGGNDLWLVVRLGEWLGAGRLIGTVASGTAKVVNPGSSSLGVLNLSLTQNATYLADSSIGYIDGRPTDAISYGNAVWFVASNPCRVSTNVEWSCVRVTKVGPTGVEDEFAIGSTAGPAFGGGIGLSGNGTLFITYSLALSNGQVATYATYRLLSDAPGKVHPSARLHTGTAAYNGTRWGDYSGITPDPTDPTSVWQGHQFSDGGWGTWVSRLMVAGSPAAGTVTINGGAASTTSPLVTLKLTPAAGSGATEALISNSPTMNGAILAKFKRTPLGIIAGWSLTATGTGGSNATGSRKVYVQFGPGNGSWKPPVSATITFTSARISRAAGPDRYATAAAVSAATFTPGVQVAYVSTGTAFAEPLVGAPLAGWLRGPLLLTQATSLNPATATELARLKPRFIVVVGSTSAITDAVKNAMAKYTKSGYVFRDSGVDRYETAAIAALNTFSAGVPVVYVAYGLNFPDALAAAAAGGWKGGPVLLTPTNSLAPATEAALYYLAPKKIYVVGGSGVISSSVFSQINQYAPTQRLAGADRFGTAVAISQATFSPGVDVAYIAYAFNFPDALAGAAAAGFRGGPVLLTGTTTLNSKTATELARLKPKRIVVLGGTGVISTAVYNQLAPYATGP